MGVVCMMHNFFEDMRRWTTLFFGELVEFISLVSNNDIARGVCTALISVFTFAFGAIDVMANALFGLIILDFIAKIYEICSNNGGIVNSFRKGHLCYKTSFNLTLKKFTKYLIIFIGFNLLGYLVYEVFKTEWPWMFIKGLMYVHFGLCELTSVVDHLIKATDDKDLKKVRDGLKTAKESLLDKLVERIINFLMYK